MIFNTLNLNKNRLISKKILTFLYRTHVEVIFTEGEITYSEDADGNMVAEDTSTSEIVFTKKDLDKITKAVSNLRKKLIEIE